MLIWWSKYTYDQLRHCDISLQQVEKQQKDFKKELKEITLGKTKHKSSSQLHVIENVKNLFNSRQKIIGLLNDNAKIRSGAISKSKKIKLREKGLKY